jgi:hypothetical protein
VVRHADNTLWKMTCEGTFNCSAWTQIGGKFSVQPTLTWDPSIQKYILIGIGNNKTSIWRSTFEADGTWNNDWTLITGASPSPVAVAAGNFGYVTTVLVGPMGTATQNGTALLNALARITANNENRYLLKIEPGIYDIGTNSLQMKEFVDVEGSGEKTTKITAAINNSDWTPTAATVIGANNAELRFLTVENTSVGPNYTIGLLNSSVSPSLIHVTATALGNANNMGIYNFSGASPSLTHVIAAASGGTGNYGVYNDSWSSPTMTHLAATASGGGYNVAILNHNSSYTITHVTATASEGGYNVGVKNECSPSISYAVTMMNVTATASGGTTNYGVYNDNSGTVKINHSVINGTTNTVYNGSGVTTYVGNTQLDGGAVSGTLTCIGAYDANYVALNTSCQ